MHCDVCGGTQYIAPGHRVCVLCMVTGKGKSDAQACREAKEINPKPDVDEFGIARNVLRVVKVGKAQPRAVLVAKTVNAVPDVHLIGEFVFKKMEMRDE